MGRREVRFCDICQQEFLSGRDAAQVVRVKFEGGRYTDAAGQGANDSQLWECHIPCWMRFALEIGKRILAEQEAAARKEAGNASQ